MKAVGTKTAHSTSAMAMTAVPTSSMVTCAASRGDRPLRMLRSTFSTTTIASSTTMPIARIRPNSVSMFTEKPRAAITAKVPISETGIADDRNDRRAPRLQEDEDDEDDEDDRLDEGLLRPPRSRPRRTRSDCRRSNIRARAGRTPSAPPSCALTAVGGGERVGARPLLDGDADRGHAVEIGVRGIAAGRRSRRAPRPCRRSSRPSARRLDDHLAELLGRLEAPERRDRDLEGGVARRRRGARASRRRPGRSAPQAPRRRRRRSGRRRRAGPGSSQTRSEGSRTPKRKMSPTPSTRLSDVA